MKKRIFISVLLVIFCISVGYIGYATFSGNPKVDPEKDTDWQGPNTIGSANNIIKIEVSDDFNSMMCPDTYKAANPDPSGGGFRGGGGGSTTVRG